MLCWSSGKRVENSHGYFGSGGGEIGRYEPKHQSRLGRQSAGGKDLKQNAKETLAPDYVFPSLSPDESACMK